MRCFISIITICLIVSVQFGCSGSAANDTDVTAVNQPIDTNGASGPQPLTEFTEAEAALAAGSKLLEDGETENAIEVLSQAVELNPDLAEAHFKLGIAYALIESRDDAAPAETPPSLKSKRPRVIKTNSEKSFEKAVKAYKKMLARNDDHDIAHFNLGLAYNKLNADEDAAKSLEAAVKLKPEDTEYQTELGSILIKLAKYNKAVSALKKALELDASNAKAELLLEKALAGRKRVDFTPVKKDEKKPVKSEPLKVGNALPDSNTKPKTSAPKLAKPPVPAQSPN